MNGADADDVRVRGDYIKLEEGRGTHAAEPSSPASTDTWWWSSCWWWAKLAAAALLVGILVAVFFKWVGPFFMEKAIIPAINWVQQTFSRSTMALIVFFSLALFPSIMLPSIPSKWVAGVTFGYGYGFLLTFAGVLIGVSLPYFMGSLFSHKIHVWLEKHPKKASIVKLAGEGNFLHQFKAVAFIRLSPFPYIVYNYIAAATDVKYIPYLLGTVGTIPEIFVALYTGIFIKTLADASQGGRPISAFQVIFGAAGFCISLAATAVVAICAKRRLNRLQFEEDSSSLLSLR